LVITLKLKKLSVNGRQQFFNHGALHFEQMHAKFALQWHQRDAKKIKKAVEIYFENTIKRVVK
jgi:tRNA A37 N6-isopentenylltransferase MiaA